MAAKVLFCPKCSQLNTDRRTTCKSCGTNLREAVSDIEQEYLDAGVELQLSERSDILSNEINKYAGIGYRVVSRTETSAQLVKPKEFNFLAALLWFLLLAVGVIIYILYYLSKKDDTVYLMVSKNGKVTRTH